jgi:hypothetical protein
VARRLRARARRTARSNTLGAAHAPPSASNDAPLKKMCSNEPCTPAHVTRRHTSPRITRAGTMAATDSAA